MSAGKRRLAPGRGLRGVVSWLCAALAAALTAATVTVAFLLARESLAYAPFTVADWWIFLNLWRPLVIAGVVLTPLFTAPLAGAAVWLIRRNRWPRPQADMIAGAAAGLLSMAILVAVARLFGPMGDGP